MDLLLGESLDLVKRRGLAILIQPPGEWQFEFERPKPQYVGASLKRTGNDLFPAADPGGVSRDGGGCSAAVTEPLRECKSTALSDREGFTAILALRVVSLSHVVPNQVHLRLALGSSGRCDLFFFYTRANVSCCETPLLS